MNAVQDNRTTGAPLWTFLQSTCGIRIVFFLFACLFLGVYNREFLYKIQDFNLFLENDRPFLTGLMQHPGGLLTYVGRYLTQFFYFPLPAAAFMAGLLVLLEWIVARAVRLGGTLQVLHFVPSMLLLLAQTSVGYFVYLDWEQSFPFMIVLGTLTALLAALPYRHMTGNRASVAAACIAVVTVYCVAGSFAWLTLCCMVAFSWRKRNAQQAFRCGTAGLLTLVVCLAVACKLSFCGMKTLLLSPLPHIGFFWPVLLALTAGLTTALLVSLREGTAWYSPRRGMLPALVAAGCVMVAVTSFHDENFRTELKLQQLAEAQDWDAMVEQAELVKQPTRAISAYRAIGLANSTRYDLASQFFDFNFDYKPVRCRLEVPEQMLYLSDFEMNCSLPNSAMRWCAEFSALYGLRPAMLRTMIMAALINRELDLATKYLKILNQTTLHKIWALKTTHFLDDIHLLYNVPYYQHLIDRMPQEDTMEDFNGITFMFSYLGEDATSFERSLVTALYFKRLDVFCAKLKQMPETSQMPYHFQEAIAFAGLSIDESYLEQYKIQPAVLDNVRNFQRQLNATEDYEEAKASLKDQFGYTLPYYIVFGEAADYDFPTIGTGSGLY